MRKFLDLMVTPSPSSANFLLELELAKEAVIPFPGNTRPTSNLAVAQGGAQVMGFPKKVPLDDFAKAYVVAALWSSHDDGEPLDDEHTIEDIASPTLEQMAADCARFQRDNAELLDAAYDTGGYGGEEQAGHDFWLTRNGHGAGFWDRGLGDLGKRLSDVARRYGDFDLYIGDDKMIHGT
jgi:hypothetical protein